MNDGSVSTFERAGRLAPKRKHAVWFEARLSAVYPNGFTFSQAASLYGDNVQHKPGTLGASFANENCSAELVAHG